MKASGRHSSTLGVERLEAPRHHADDRVGLPVDAQVASDRAGIAAELAPPERVAQHHLLLVADLAFVVREDSAERGRDAT